ncbi:outer membrane beta-barrel protein [Rhodobacterales bacterium]|nr:outer membrane beta-barrel protein [Rhodobacterales bacterium]
MRLYVHLLLCCAILHAAPAAAQSTAASLRGSADAADAEQSEDGADPADENTVVNPTQSNVYALRPTLNSAEAETDSSGLGSSGPVVPVRPFSDRIAAVSRSVTVNGETLDTEVFAGDTTFDQPRGIRLGTFTLTPQLTVTSGWTDNTAGSAGGTGGGLYRISPDVGLTSNWSRHQFDASLRGTYTGYPENSDDNDGSVTATANLRLDVSDRTRIESGLSYSYAREEDGSAESSSGVDNNQTISGTLGVTRAVGIVAATVGVGADRNTYSSDVRSEFSEESGRDNTLYSASLRLDGNTGSVISPFVEGALLLRRYDNTCTGALCENRNANGYEAVAGVTIASAKLAGELGAGWHLENLEDENLDDLSALVLNGSLVWSPTRLTTVTAGLGTSFSSSDIDGASGSVVYSGDLRLAHVFSDRFVGETGVGYSYRTYEGVSIEERTLSGFAGLTFALTRNLALTADYTHRRFDSSQQGSDYNENAVEAGLRFRH